jgi:hypothetical protein
MPHAPGRANRTMQAANWRWRGRLASVVPMNVVLRKPMTLEAFLDWEERQELRYEFDGFQPVARTGGTSEHSAIQRNLITALTI